MTNWNPGAPNKLGLQFATRLRQGETSAVKLGSSGNAVAQFLDSTVTENLSTSRTVTNGTNILGAPGIPAPISYNVHEWLISGSEVATGRATATYRPNRVTQTGNVSGGTVENQWETNAGSTDATLMANAINETTLNTGTYLVIAPGADPFLAGGPTAELQMEFSTAGQLAGKRILDIRVNIIGLEIVPTDNAGFYLGAGINHGFDSVVGNGVNSLYYMGFGGANIGLLGHPYLQTNPFGTESSTDFAYSTIHSPHIWSFGEVGTPRVPVAGNMSGQLVNVSDFQAMDTSTAPLRLAFWNPLPIEYIADPVDSANDKYYPNWSSWVIFQVWIDVDYCTENRRAVCYACSTNQGFMWDTAPPYLPAGGGTLWAKTSGQDCTHLIRTIRSGDCDLIGGIPTSSPAKSTKVLHLPSFGEFPSNMNLHSYQDVVMNADGTVADLGPISLSTLYGSVLVSGSAISVDGQPYTAVIETAVTNGSGNRQQEISGASAQNYRGVRLPLGVDETAGVVGNLTIALKRRSDNVVMGTATVTRDAFLASDLEPIGEFWRMVQVDFAVAAALATSTQYYLDFTSTGTGSWILQRLTSEAPVVNTSDGTTGATTTWGNPGYTGTTNAATTDSTERGWEDYSAVVFATVPVITGFTATASEQTQTYEADCPPGTCTMSIPTVEFTWNATGLSTDFLSYEIQRMDQDNDWQSIALITDPDVLSFVDYEALIGVESSYRIRQSDIYNFYADWSAEVEATPEAIGLGLTLTTNEQPELNVAYSDIYNGSVQDTYTFDEANEVVEQNIYGRDYTVAFQPLERRGVRFSRLLNVGGLTCVRPGPKPFEAVRNLAKAALSYVCVRDSEGNRWYASIRVPSGDVKSRRLHVAQLTVVEITDTPSQPNAVAL